MLYSIIGTGGEFRADVGSIIDGSLLALDRDINLKGGFVNGQVFSRKAITIMSGAAVRCPTP